jgi:hypothetical protein
LECWASATVILPYAPYRAIDGIRSPWRNFAAIITTWRELSLVHVRHFSTHLTRTPGTFCGEDLMHATQAPVCVAEFLSEEPHCLRGSSPHNGLSRQQVDHQDRTFRVPLPAHPRDVCLAKLHTPIAPLGNRQLVPHFFPTTHALHSPLHDRYRCHPNRTPLENPSGDRRPIWDTTTQPRTQDLNWPR